VLDKFILGFNGMSLGEELADLLEEGLTGVAIFKRNWTSLDGLHSLTREIRRAAGRPVLIGIDQEGGTRFSLPEPFTQWPSPSELGLVGDPLLVEQIAGGMARELRAAGCNLNFAPMLDLHVNPTSQVTEHRSFGADPHQVAQLGAAFIRGLTAKHVLACAKHFPGHGDTQVDPHEDLPIFQGAAERLAQVELLPFARAISRGVPLIMTAHILLPQIDPERPASLSRRMLAGTLRQQLGFRGAILADDLGMGAIARRWGPGEAAVETFLAGSDLALLCHDWAAVRPSLDTVEEALHCGRFNAAEWQASRERIEQLLNEAEPGAHDQPSLDIVGCPEHRALATKIRKRVEAVRR
jgi:beta-N-acetylhexosaminidase